VIEGSSHTAGYSNISRSSQWFSYSNRCFWDLEGYIVTEKPSDSELDEGSISAGCEFALSFESDETAKIKAAGSSRKEPKESRIKSRKR